MATITIQYKSDSSTIPYCAYTINGGDYECAWSSKSFQNAKAQLLAKLRVCGTPPLSPDPEEVEL